MVPGSSCCVLLFVGSHLMWCTNNQVIGKVGVLTVCCLEFLAIGAQRTWLPCLLKLIHDAVAQHYMQACLQACATRPIMPWCAIVYLQVLCNSAVPTMLCVAYGAMAGCVDLPLGAVPSIEPWRADILTLLMGGFLGYYACCCGDTWASELGVLSTDQPRLITNMQPVRRGTNGGVTLLGLSASIAGGLFMGLVFYMAAIMSPTLWVFDAQVRDTGACVGSWHDAG